jgi:xanthine dehydrogenase YagR molybdenum-binding subunit
MSQNPQKPKEKIVAAPHKAIVVNLPMVRDYSTGGGHLPGDTVVEGDENIVTKKWQGYPPQNLNVIGKPFPPMPEVAIPRYTGKAEFATRVNFPNQVWIKVVANPHPRARVRRMDVSRAEKMPGVAYILTAANAPKTYPFPEELFFQGELVAMVAADTEDLAEDAAAAINVEYEVLPSQSTVEQAMEGRIPELRPRPANYEVGDVEKGFAEADVIKEFTYRWSGAIPVPIQPGGGVAKWDGDRLTFWGFGQGIYPQRVGLSRALAMDESKIRFIDKYNGCTLGGGMSLARLNPWIAWIAKESGRPAKLMLQKDHELAFLQIKPQNVVHFKVGAKKDGKITAVHRTFHVNVGVNASVGGAAGQGGGRSELYVHVIPNWKDTGFTYRTNTMLTGPSRSNMQQEFKWGWEQMMDEMAEALGLDPIQFRLLNVQKPGTTLTHQQGGPTVVPMPESKNGTLTYDSYAVVEVLQEGAKVIGWDNRNAKPGGAPGRFKRGIGVALNQHHAGRVGYHDGEEGFKWVTSRRANVGGIQNAGGGPQGGGGGTQAAGAVQGAGREQAADGGQGGGTAGAPANPDVFNGFVILNADGHIVLHFAQPDSGTNHATSMSAQVAELLGFTDLRQMRVIWGDSELTPRAPGWNSGLTTQLQGGALNRAADLLRQDLVKRAAARLKADPARLAIRDGVISSMDNPSSRVTFAQLARANGGTIRQDAACVHPGSIGRSMNRGVGCCFAEVEVDTYTGNWRFVNAAYCHDSGNVVNPLLAEGDMDGSLVQSFGVATDAIPWDREFPGTAHYAVGFLSYRLPTIMDVPEQTNVFVNSLEPRWFFGCKGFAETAIGAPPGALANAIYNACGVRIREHPITREKIMAGLKALKARGETA